MTPIEYGMLVHQLIYEEGSQSPCNYFLVVKATQLWEEKHNESFYQKSLKPILDLCEEWSVAIQKSYVSRHLLENKFKELSKKHPDYEKTVRLEGYLSDRVTGMYLNEYSNDKIWRFSEKEFIEANKRSRHPYLSEAIKKRIDEVNNLVELRNHINNEIKSQLNIISMEEKISEGVDLKKRIELMKEKIIITQNQWDDFYKNNPIFIARYIWIDNKHQKHFDFIDEQRNHNVSHIIGTKLMGMGGFVRGFIEQR